MSNKIKNRRDFSIQFAVFGFDVSFVYYRGLPIKWGVAVVKYRKDNSKELRAVLGRAELNIDFGFYSRLFYKPNKPNHPHFRDKDRKDKP